MPSEKETQLKVSNLNLKRQNTIYLQLLFRLFQATRFRIDIQKFDHGNHPLYKEVQLLLIETGKLTAEQCERP